MFDTIVIGAGLAGLAAGQYLQNHQIDNFIVLESAPSIGGRIQTIDFGNKKFAAGPGWIHGKKGNPIFDLLDGLQVSMEVSKSVQDGIIFVWDTDAGKDVSNEYLERREILKDLIEKVGENLYEETIEPGKSFRDLISENTEFYKTMTDLDRIVLYTCMEIYVGAPLNELSGMVEIQHDEVYNDEEGVINYRIIDPLGLPKLVEHLSNDFKSKIKLNSKVHSIEWENEFGFVSISLDNGELFQCKNVIITVQSNLLARKSIIFKPELPEEKILSWKHVPAVNYCRIFAKFPRKFWPNKEWLMPVFKDISPLNELIFWQNCASQHLCMEEDNILTCHFTSGSNIDHIRFDVDKESLIKLVAESMKNMFPDTFCEPIDVLMVSFWNSDRYAGSFSQASPGITKNMINQLVQNVGPLHFAGESVMVQLIGTMQGAYSSGVNAARKVIESLSEL